MMQLYFVAIIPNEPNRQHVVRFKERFAEGYGARHALKSPPHITLIPPFRFPAARESSLNEVLDEFAAGRRSFTIVIDGFDGFPPRVVFFRVRPSELLMDLQGSLQQFFIQETSVEIRNMDRPFHPHMTIAFKDLGRKAYRRAMHDLKDRTFRLDFLVDRLYLLMHNGTRWVECHASPLGVET